MSRVKRGPGPRRRHQRVFKQTEGFVGGRRNRYREAVRSLLKSWQYAFAGRKQRKRDFRRLWITRINAACRIHGMTYGRFIASLKAAEVELDRKVLADMAVNEPALFEQLVRVAREHAADLTVAAAT
jgi:large subunit ribosomal protein L20